MDRRQVLGLGAGLIAAGLAPRAGAEAMNADGQLSTDPREVLALWPGTPPGGAHVHLKTRIVERSTDLEAFHDRFADTIGMAVITVFRPQKPNGAGIVIAPGGGYQRVVIDKEGIETARFLNAAGFTCFLLRYRLPDDGWENKPVVPLQDAQRAMRLIRSRAKEFGIDPAKLGVMGFSAGGHVAASLTTMHGDRVYDAVDQADTFDAAPAYACLMYPVITMRDGLHRGSRDRLLGAMPSDALVDNWSCEKRVTAATPPCFIAYAADDTTVMPVPNALAMVQALMAVKVPCEVHGFDAGGHGFGIRLAQGQPCAVWPELFLTWAKIHGFAGEAV